MVNFHKICWKSQEWRTQLFFSQQPHVESHTPFCSIHTRRSELTSHLLHSGAQIEMPIPRKHLKWRENCDATLAGEKLIPQITQKKNLEHIHTNLIVHGLEKEERWNKFSHARLVPLQNANFATPGSHKPILSIHLPLNRLLMTWPQLHHVRHTILQVFRENCRLLIEARIMKTLQNDWK